MSFPIPVCSKRTRLGLAQIVSALVLWDLGCPAVVHSRRAYDYCLSGLERTSDDLVDVLYDGLSNVKSVNPKNSYAGDAGEASVQMSSDSSSAPRVSHQSLSAVRSCLAAGRVIEESTG